MWMISSVALAFVAVMCVVGVLSHNYNDNLAQRVGMSLLCFGSLSRAHDMWYTHFVQPETMLAHFGMALMAGGTWYKVYQYSRKKDEDESK